MKQNTQSQEHQGVNGDGRNARRGGQFLGRNAGTNLALMLL